MEQISIELKKHESWTIKYQDGFSHVFQQKSDDSWVLIIGSVNGTTPIEIPGPVATILRDSLVRAVTDSKEGGEKEAVASVRG